MKKGDWLLLAGCLLLGAVGLLLASLSPADQAPAAAGDALYARVQVDGETQAVLPLDHEATYRIATGEDGENLLHVTPDSIRMESANCHNQLCVLQGTVTLANCELRPLGAMIVCAPHKVVCELLTAEQAAALTDAPVTGAVTEGAAPHVTDTPDVTVEPPMGDDAPDHGEAPTSADEPNGSKAPAGADEPAGGNAPIGASAPSDGEAAGEGAP